MASRKTLHQEALAGMPGRYIDCRDMAHHWVMRNMNNPKGEPGSRYVLRELACRRCPTTKVEWEAWDGPTAGQVFKRRYHYPPGYLFAEEVGQVSRREVRVWATRAYLQAMRGAK